MREVQLFIKPEGQTDYLKVDLFDDENISLTQTIKNAQDVSKIFTDFSKTFTIPASKVNNKIFKHYYNFAIDNGFDGRKRVDARIEINRVPFKVGRVRLDGVELKDDKAYAYKITFFGNTIKLRDSIGEDKLGALDLNQYNTTYSATAIEAGLTTADPATSDIIVPLITHTQRLTYGTGAVANSGDLKADASVNHGVFWKELKYAIRVDAVVQAIANKYGFTFSSDSFFNNTNVGYYNLFMWLHRKKGNVQSDITNTPLLGLISGFNGPTSQSNFAWRNTAGNQIVLEDVRYLTAFSLGISNPNGLTYDIAIKRDGDQIILKQNVTNAQLFIDVLNFARVGSDYEVLVSADAANNMQFEWTAVLEEPFNPGQTATFYVDAVVGNDPDFNISEQIPEMKVMDFLSGLFKMFNLVAEIDEQNVVTVKPLDEYYGDGVFRDITRYVDNSTSSVDVAIPFAEIEYKYKSTGTILADQYNKLTNKEWGADSYNTESNLKEGGKFTVEIPFEHVQFERINDESTGAATPVMYGYYVDDNQDSYIGAPLLFYPVLNPLSGTNISFVTTKDADGNFTAANTITTSINVPSNSVTLDGAGDVYDNIHFYLENNEYDPNIEFFETLFYNYHYDYIASLFNFRKRMTKVKAHLPVPILINYSLADTFVIQGNRYKINSINTNLNTGESQLELLNVVDVAKPNYGQTEIPENLFAAITGDTAPDENTSKVYSAVVTGTATGATTYEWSVSNGGSIVGSNTNPSVEIAWAEVSEDSVRTITLTVRRNNDGNPVSFTTQPYTVTVQDTTVAPPPEPLAVDIVQSGSTPDDAVAEGALRIYDAVLYGDYTTPLTYTWTADGGTIDSGQGTDRVTVTWNEIPGDTGSDYNGSIALSVTSADSQTDSASYPVRVVDGTTAPYINVSITNVATPVEQGYTTTYGTTIDSNITTANPDVWSWSITGGTINSGQFSDLVNVTWDTAGTGSISVSVTREGETGTDSATIEVIALETTATITGDFTDAEEGTVRSYGSIIGGNTTGTITYSWIVDKGEISGGSYDGLGRSVISGVGIDAIDVTWGIYEVGTGSVSLTATREGIDGSDVGFINVLPVYYVFDSCVGGETVVSRQISAPPSLNQAYVDYSNPEPVYYTYNGSTVNSTAGFTELGLQPYTPTTFGCPSPPPPPENVISISGPTTADSGGETGVEYTIITDPQTVVWSASHGALTPELNPVPITITSSTSGVGNATLVVTFGAYNGNGTETLYSQIRIDDDSSDVYDAVTVSQSPPPPPPPTTYYIFTACDPLNADVMIESATVPATDERAVGGFDNYYTYANATTTDPNAYPIATLTLEGVTGCPAVASCTTYEVFNEGSSVSYFLYRDCTSGGNRLLDVSPGQTRSVCAYTDEFAYSSGDTNYTISILGPC